MESMEHVVNATRVVETISAQLAEMRCAPQNGAASSSGAVPQPQPRTSHAAPPPAQAYDIGTQRSVQREPRRRETPQDETNETPVQSPCRANAYKVIQDTEMNDDMIAGAHQLPAGGSDSVRHHLQDSWPGGRLRGGFRQNPHECIPQGKVEELTLRVGPPKTDDMRSKGGLLGNSCLAINVPPFHDPPIIPEVWAEQGPGLPVMRVCYDETTPTRLAAAKTFPTRSARTRPSSTHHHSQLAARGLHDERRTT